MADQSQTITGTDADRAEMAGQMAHDLRKLLANGETRRLGEDVRADIERLSRWADTYADGLQAAQQIAETAAPALAEAQKELQMAYEQYLRLEDEGGNPATPAQQRTTDDLARALKRLHGLIPAVEQTFAAGRPDNEPDMEPPEQEPGVGPEVTPPLENPTTPPDVQPFIPPVTDPEM